MKTKNKKELLLVTISLFIIAVVYTLLVKFVDVQRIGPNDSLIGFANINGWFHKLTGYSEFWHKLTTYLGVLPFLIIAYYGIIGIKQLIKYKKISKVDKKIILLGVFYVLVGLTFIFFEKVVINYRPILEDGILEASYPSTHTLLAVCICASSLVISSHYVAKKYLKIFDNFTYTLMLLLVVGRLISGVHWLTDIIGGILISLFLVSLYEYLISNVKK